MGGGGFAQHATNVMKGNRALLKKGRTFKKVKGMFLNTAQVTEVEFKEVSPEKLARIKMEIRRKARNDAWKEAGLYIACIAVVTYGLYWLFYL